MRLSLNMIVVQLYSQLEGLTRGMCGGGKKYKFTCDELVVVNQNNIGSLHVY